MYKTNVASGHITNKKYNDIAVIQVQYINYLFFVLDRALPLMIMMLHRSNIKENKLHSVTGSFNYWATPSLSV